jgi:hypothetical protein
MSHTRLDAAVTLPGEDFSRVALTAEAVRLLRKLWAQHGPLMFHQSGGCCDGSAPMCYPAGDFLTGESDVLLGRFDLLALTTADGPVPLDDGGFRVAPATAAGRWSSGCPGNSSATGATPT